MRYRRRAPSPKCPRCDDTFWVCEEHDHVPSDCPLPAPVNAEGPECRARIAIRAAGSTSRRRCRRGSRSRETGRAPELTDTEFYDPKILIRLARMIVNDSATPEQKDRKST